MKKIRNLFKKEKEAKFGLKISEPQTRVIKLEWTKLKVKKKIFLFLADYFLPT